MTTFEERITQQVIEIWAVGKTISPELCYGNHMLIPGTDRCGCGSKRRPESQYHPNHDGGDKKNCDVCKLKDRLRVQRAKRTRTISQLAVITNSRPKAQKIIELLETHRLIDFDIKRLSKIIAEQEANLPVPEASGR